jgi:hypothetical protein
MLTARMRLPAACLALCVTTVSAFAPLGLPAAPCAGRASRSGIVGLRAARSAEPVSVSRRDLGRALVFLGGASVFPSVSQSKMTKATAEDTIAAWNKLMDAKDQLNPDVINPMVEVGLK